MKYLIGLTVCLLLALTTAVPTLGESITFPPGSGVIDMSKPPYNLTGDGVTDVTAAIQGVLSTFAAAGSAGQKILYFPNGTYLISSTLAWSQGQGTHGWFGFLNFQGQSQAGTVFKLKDNTPGFTDPNTPKPMMNCGYPGSADLFWNSVRNLTFNSGSGNPGAIGLQFFSNNQGIVRDVTLKSGDGSGISGLDLGYQNLNGPLLIKNLTVDGFNTGISDGFEINSQTFENITLRNQKVVGFNGTGQELFIRGLNSTNSVPAFSNTYGTVTLIDASLVGTGLAALSPAITNGGYLYARNIVTSGYQKAIKSNNTYPDAAGPNVTEFASDSTYHLFPSPSRSLGLPVNETPDVPYDDPATWANVRDFGARGDGPYGHQQYRGGDGFGYDGGVWGNAIVTKADGTVRHLAGQYDYRYAGGTFHNLAADEIAWNDNPYFNYQFPVIDSGLTLNGVNYPRGISISWSDFHFNLNGQYKTFSTDIGVNDSNLGEGSVQFEVYCDGVLKYNSYVMYCFDPTLHINLDLTGVNDLEIKMGDGEDDTRYVQAAIDSGATTVYFPNSTHNTYTVSNTVFLRGSVRRLTSTQASINVNMSTNASGIKLVGGTAPIVIWDRLGSGFGGVGQFFEHASSRTFVIRSAQFGTYTNSGTGDLYIEDVVGGPFTFNQQNVWARQFNVENHGTHVTNNGGNLWILGMKTESGGTLIDTENGGKTELLGCFCYTTESGALAPMYINNNSSLSVTGQSEAWYNYGDSPYTTLVQETRGTTTRSLLRGQTGLCAMQGSAYALYTGYVDSTETAPVAPTGLVATAQDSAVKLAWNPVTNAYGYNVKRSTVSGGSYTTIASYVTATNYTDTSVSDSVRYYYVVTAVNSNAESANSNVASATPQYGLTGTGLLGNYYTGTNFNTLAVSRIDSTINFVSPPFYTGGAAANFSVRWTGQVLPAKSETYTFYLRGDDGVRLYVNGIKLVDAFYDQAATEYSGTIALTAGKKTDIIVEYYQGGGQAVAQLSWASASTPKQIIPREALFPAVSISGTLTFEGIVPTASTQPVRFQFRDAAAHSTLFEQTVSVGANGAFTLSGVNAGSYDLWIKGSKNLAALVSVNASGGDTTGITAFLPGGDADNSNAVNFDDFLLLLNAFGSDTSVSGSGYDATADFNGDGKVNFDDFLLLLGNFGTAGAS